MTEERVPSPSCELLDRWTSEWHPGAGSPSRSLADKAADWGYRQGIARGEEKIQAAVDAELEECLKWLRANGYRAADAGRLRAARRPKPPSLKQQALKALESAPCIGPDGDDHLCIVPSAEQVIRRALESIPEDES